jgi:DNA-binding transcriptional LysR family regulator
MDTLACMQAFATVVEAGNFSEAARRLGVSKAQISKQVIQLEDSLAVRLLHRTTRKVTPTSSGQAYFEQCRPLLDELDQLHASMQFTNASPRGELHIAAPQTFAEMHLMSVVSNYARRYPDVIVDLQLTDRYVDLVEERIDVAIRIGTLDDSTLVARKLGDVRMQLCASPDYIAEYGEPEEPRQLSHHHCILDSNYAGGNHWTLGRADQIITVEVQPHLIVNSARAGRELVLAGHGIGFLPSFAIAEDIKQGKLKAVLPMHIPGPIGIYASYLNRKHLSAKVRLFIEMAVEKAGLAD